MKAEIIAVGTEILLGDIVNTNATYLSRRLSELGIYVYHESVVGDNEDRLLEEFHDAFKRADIVITTGGLGPTQDDLTKETGAKFFNRKLVLHEESLTRIIDYFKKSNRSLTEGNKKQAYMPEGAIILKNDHGTAPGCIIEDDGKILIVLPGPPKEAAPMFEDTIVPYLDKFRKGILKSRVLRVLGIGEGHMADKIDHIIKSSVNPTVAPYAKDCEAILRLTASCKTLEECNELLDEKEMEIRKVLGKDIYAVGETSIEEVILEILRRKNYTISTAESCTGGLLAGKLINCSGISDYFLEGAITYSNEAKMKRLKVSGETLKKFGAVSYECAEEMAKGMAEAAGTNIAISVTGIAGPTGAAEDKPVGLIYIGLYINGLTKVKKCNFSGDRNTVRNRTVNTALDFLRRELI